MLKVNGETISNTSLEQEKLHLARELNLNQEAMNTDKVKLMIHDRSRQNVIDHILFKQEAIRQGFSIENSIVDGEINSIAERNGGMEKLLEHLQSSSDSLEDLKGHIRDRKLVDLLVEKVHGSVSEPKERHAKKVFKENPSQFFRPRRAKVLQIAKKFSDRMGRIRCKGELEKIVSAVRAGKSFKTMLLQKSDLKGNDGDLGWVQNGDLPDVFDRFIVSAQEREVSEPIEYGQAWFLLWVEELEQEREGDFEEFKARIIEELWTSQKQEKLLELLKKLRKKASIEES